MRRMLVVAAAVLAVAGCKKSESPAAGPEAAKMPPSMGMGAQAQMAMGQPPGQQIKGKILERLEAEPYTYLKLATGSGETWAAVPKTDAAVGTEVAVVQSMVMPSFESKTLNRKFENIVFGTVAGAGAAAAGGAMGGAMPPGHPGAQPAAGAEPAPSKDELAAQHAGVAAAAADVGPIKVKKADGPEGRTVAELYAQKTALKDKPVAVRGKVVKFSAGIMGKNWIHLRDGTGKAEDKTDDLTVTTMDNVSVGDEILAKGALHTDKNFGAGYEYGVIVEDAKVTK